VEWDEFILARLIGAFEAAQSDATEPTFKLISGTHMDEFNRPVTAAGVRAASEAMRGEAVETPLLEHPVLNERAGGRVLLKAEVLQRGGSFKFRGAFTRLQRLSPDARARGVLAWSSGNHALGVALAARRFDCPATILMPADAPAIKAEQVRAAGAEIITFDRYKDDREAIGRRIAVERGLALAPSYDHPDIIEGQGTLALEAIRQAASIGAGFDAFVFCCGGGGMTAGCATILSEISPQTDVIVAEPEGYAETWASILAGERLRNDVSRKTICDAIATPTPGEITFPILQRHVRGGAALTEDEVETAMAFAFKYLKLVVEPGGVVALATILAGKVKTAGLTVGAVLSGGNVDPALYARALSRPI
jgi:threonine dehydratase